MHKIKIVLLCIILALILTSCLDAKEIDEQAYVLTVGIDMGISNRWRVTLQIPTLKGDSGGMGGGGQSASDKKPGKQEGYTVTSLEGASFLECINLIETSIPRHINFEHLKFIVISEEMARSGELGEFMAPLRRFGQIRDTSRVIISKGSAEKFVNELKSFIGTRISKSQELYFQGSKDTSYFPNITLEDIYDGYKSTYRQPIATIGGVNNFENYKEEGDRWSSKELKPGSGFMAGQLPRKGESSIELLGTAVFDGDRMIGELNGAETRFLLLGRGQLKRSYFTIPDPKRPELLIPLDIRQKKSHRKVSVRFEKGKAIIHLKLELEGDIMAIQSRINYESPELKPVLEKAVELQIKKGLDKLIAKTLALNSDVFNFGRNAAWHFNTIQEFEEYYWIKQYKNSEITTEVKFTIKRTGTMMGSSPIITTKGKE